MSDDYRRLVQRFESPGVVHRPQMFWVWNGKLERERIREQVADLSKAGCGGFFIHPMGEKFRLADFIEGIEPAYLSEEYFQAVRWAVEAAREHGLLAWLYDEGGWPSGTAQGHVAAGRPDLEAQVLRVHRSPALGQATAPRMEGCVAATVVLQGRAPEALAIAEDTLTLPEDAVAVLQFVPERVAGRTDLLNPETTQRFIEVTHERYAVAVGDFFGDTIPGMFTDEPAVSGRVASAALPWTPVLADCLVLGTGQSLGDLLPLVFSAEAVGDGVHDWFGEARIGQARCEFCDCWTARYRRAYWEPLNEWCEANGLVHTGHVGGEDTLLEHGQHGFGHFFRTAGMLHVPGVDAIWRQLWWDKANFDYPRFASSAARQRASGEIPEPWDGAVITETNGVYGPGLTYEQMRWLVDFQCAAGVNLIAPMAYTYDPTGGKLFRTQDDLGPGHPLWPLYGSFADYVGRLCAVLRTSHGLADVAVYYPVEALWAGPDSEGAREAARSLSMLSLALGENQVAFDYIDAETLSGAPVVEGALETPGENYSAVVIPAVQYLPVEVLEKLAELHEGGGRVIFAEAIPGLATRRDDEARHAVLVEELSRVAFRMDVEAEATKLDESERLDGITAAYMGARDPDHFAIGATASEAVLIAGEDEIWRLGRLLALTCGRYAVQPEAIEHDLRLSVWQAGDVQVALALNLADHSRQYGMLVVSETPGVLERWDCLEGSRRPLAWHDEVSESTRLVLELPAHGSALLVLRPLEPGEPSPAAARPAGEKLTVVLEPLVQPDAVRVRSQSVVAEGAVQVELDPPLSVPRRLGDWADLGLVDFSGCVEYEFGFTVAAEFVGERLLLDLGTVNYCARIDLNGHTMRSLWPPHVLDISGLVVAGDNRLRVRVSNTLANQVASDRVVADARLHGWFNGYYARALPMMRESLPSGLVGPVRILVGDLRR